MITNARELEVATENLKWFQAALESLRTEMEEANPKMFIGASRMFAAVSLPYIRRIADLQEEIYDYLADNMVEVEVRRAAERHRDGD